MTARRADMDDDPARRATYYAPTRAFARGGPAVPVHVFGREHVKAHSPDAPTGFVPLDLSAELQLPWAATTPLLLARYLVIRPDEAFSHCLAACGEVYYVLSGAGHTACAGGGIDWHAGDGFCLPGSQQTTHTAAGSGALLLIVTNEPELARLGLAQTVPRFVIPPTHFAAERIASVLEDVHRRDGPQLAAGKSVVFVTPPMASMNLTTPTLLASINTLEPGGDQRPHRHNSVALTLSIQGQGVYSIIDGRRVDWIDGAVMLTPPATVHSHHNSGLHRMMSFVAQDTGLHTHTRTTGFCWTDTGPAPA